MDDQSPSFLRTLSRTPPMSGSDGGQANGQANTNTNATDATPRPATAATAATTATAASTRSTVTASPPARAQPATAQARTRVGGSRRGGAHGERSCIVCHRRKVRCDKTVPCANCTRAGVLCCYPSAKKAPRQAKATIADIASRLVQLERTIVAIAGSDDHGDDDAASTQPALASASASAPTPTPVKAHTPGNASSADDEFYARDRRDDHYGDGSTATEMLLKNQYASRYINEVLLSRVLEEEQEFRSALTSPRESETDELPDDAAAGHGYGLTLFGSLSTSRYVPRMPSLRTSSLHPSKAHALQLWQKYILVVEPMNKIIHVPTDEIEVFTLIDNPDKADPAFESLLFAIYYATVTVYQPDEYRDAFGESKAVAADRYRAGMERALAQARFLESPGLRTLQAQTLFLRSFRAHSPGRGIWILYGMVLRAAQAIGLHRDGANFNLPVFESEMRRRVWAHMLAQDGRAAEDHGIAICGTDMSTDIQLARNVNDCDIHPGMLVLPPSRARWTEMTLNVCLQLINATGDYMTRLINAMKVQVAAASSAGLPPGPLLTEERRRAIMADRNRYAHELMQHCNLVVPIQRATYKVVRLVERKFDFVLRLQLATFLARYDKDTADTQDTQDTQDTADTPDGRDGRDAPMVIATEENLRLACNIIEINVNMMEDEKIKDFRWSAEMFPQYHALLYTLWHMCVRPRPAGPDQDGLRARAWAAVDGMFALEASRQQRQSVRGGNAKWAVLAVLRDKALRLQSGDVAATGQTDTERTDTGRIDTGRTDTGRTDTAMADASIDASTDASTVETANAAAQTATVPVPASAPVLETQPPTYAAAPAAPATTPGTMHTPYHMDTRQYPLPPPPPVLDTGGTSFAGPEAHAMPGTLPSMPLQSYLIPGQLPNADMMEFLGDTTMGMGMDVDWVRSFLGWNQGDEQWRGTYDQQ